MVLFLAKSATCIGLVAALAAGVDVGGLASTVGHGARAAAERAGHACLRSEPCLRASVGALASAAATPAPEATAARPARPARTLRPAGA